ncbi:hypothetical protein MKP08_01990 [Erythrobacter sp. LQ02-29]|uniref:GNAT family N-acetyltransferase n=1 Tax=Erythrobacter sp. LQ02-29 TaxID=2920384 RepID=UPI001F4E4D44|nr:GNAT family N-acetyltransferase [Erythrobacter sp. LQ02-29]MCP9221519.1 hypothetical protein [Erythrobacter sp. LQ02-29]
MNDVSIERAGDAQMPEILPLLAPLAGTQIVAFVARDGNGAVLGAGGIGWQSWGDPPGFPAWIHVMPDHRRAGVGRALARALIERTQGEAPALWAIRPLVEGEPAPAFAKAMGMEPRYRQLRFRGDAQRLYAHLVSILDRLRRHDRIPDGATCVRLDGNNAAAVAALVRREVRGASPAIGGWIAQALKDPTRRSAIDLDRSRVLEINGVVAGAVLTRRLADGDNSEIICTVVSPEVRGGWANVLVLTETTRTGAESTCDWYLFDCAHDNRDTLGLARRTGAEHLGTEENYYYAIVGRGAA